MKVTGDFPLRLFLLPKETETAADNPVFFGRQYTCSSVPSNPPSPACGFSESTAIRLSLIHIYVATNGREVLTANYSGGTMSVFPLQKDGTLAPADTLFQGSAKMCIRDSYSLVRCRSYFIGK